MAVVGISYNNHTCFNIFRFLLYLNLVITVGWFLLHSIFLWGDKEYNQKEAKSLRVPRSVPKEIDMASDLLGAIFLVASGHLLYACITIGQGLISQVLYEPKEDKTS